jgi:hypothetical protein
MGRTVTLTTRYTNTVAALNAWTLAGGGLLITLAGNPFLGPLLVIAGLVFIGLAVSGRLQRQQSISLSQSLLTLLGIPVMFVGLLLLGGGLVPARFNLLWYGFLGVMVVLTVSAIVQLARFVRSDGRA